MISNFDEILLELSYRTETGLVDLTQDSQVNILIDILKENGIENAEVLAQKARVYFSYLNEASIIEKGKNPAKSIKAVGSRGGAKARPSKPAMKPATQSKAKKPQTGAASKANSLAKDAQSKGVMHLGKGYYGKSKGAPATYKKDDSGTRLVKIKPGEGPQYKGTQPAQQKGKVAQPAASGRKPAPAAKQQAPKPNIPPAGFKSDAEKRQSLQKIKALQQKKQSQQKGKSNTYQPTEGQLKTFKGQKRVLAEVVQKGFLANVEKITKGVGAFEPSEAQLKALVDVTKKQLKNPNYKLKLPKFKISDEDVDIAVGIVKNKLGADYKRWEQQIMKSGAVDSFLTTGENGKKRFRAIVQKYLETGGRSAITGKFVPFNRMQLDHHIPFGSAKQAVLDKKKKGIKTTIEKEKARLDSPPNWDLMETELNQFKNSLEGNALIAKAAKRLNMSPDEKELKKIQTELQSLQKDQLFSNLVNSFGKGDYSGFNEQSISSLNGNDANMLAKAWNYWHPNPKTPEFRDNVKNDPNYLKKLKKAGIDYNKPSPVFVQRYQAQIGGSRTRGVAKSPIELKKTIFQMMKKAGAATSKKETLKSDTALAKAVLSIQKKSKELTAREKELKQKIKQRAKK